MMREGRRGQKGQRGLRGENLRERCPLNEYHEFRAGERVACLVLFGGSGWLGQPRGESNTLYFTLAGEVKKSARRVVVDC